MNPCLKKPSIMLRNGNELDLREPDLTGLTIYDAARTLARILRFCAHSSVDVSLADHSVFVWKITCKEVDDPLVQWAALMHDVHELICGDNSAPFKMLVPEIKPHEKKYHYAILKHFLRDAGFVFKERFDAEEALTLLRDDSRVKVVDGFALDVERLLFMPKPDPGWWQVGQSAHVWLANEKRKTSRPYAGPLDDEIEVRSYSSVMDRRANRFIDAYAAAVGNLHYSEFLQCIGSRSA